MPGRRTEPLSPQAFDAWAEPNGALFVGSPQEIIEKILWEHEVLGHDRFMAQVGLGGLPQHLAERSLENLATTIAPAEKLSAQTSVEVVKRLVRTIRLNPWTRD